MGRMKTMHKRRKRRTAKQGAGKSAHKGRSGRTGSMHTRKLKSRRDPNARPQGDQP